MKKLYSLLLLFIVFTTSQAQIINIPDANFMGKLLEANAFNNIAKNQLGNFFKIDSNNNGQIEDFEALEVSYLDLQFSNISNLIGLEYFSNLNFINCNYNTISVLDISQNQVLKTLLCSNNQITNLDLINNLSLESLECDENLISSLNTTQNTSLKNLSCGSNQLTTLNVSQNILLTRLICRSNLLTNLNVSQNTMLETLVCSNNSLTSIDISNNNNLKNLSCDYNQIPVINLTQNPHLTYLVVNNNLLMNLNVTQNPDLNLIYCGGNNLTGINVSQNLVLQNLRCNNNNISNLNITPNTAITELDCSNNQLSTIDLSQNINLLSLHINNNQLNNLNISQNNNIEYLYCSNNNLTTLNVFNCLNLSYFQCQNNQITTLDLSQNTVLYEFNCNNNQLTELFLKNNRYETDLYFENNPNLTYICADEAQLSDIQNKISNYGYTNCHVNTYCSFIPGGAYYTISGISKYDDNNDGCDSFDSPLPNMQFNISDGINSGVLITNTSGNYSIPVNQGMYTIEPIIENANYFTISPTNVVVDFPTDVSPYTQNFCVTPIGVHPDLEVSIIPINAARPGFDAKYKMIYKNKGNTTQSGSVNIAFNDAVLDFVSANPVVSTQTLNNLSWDFTNLLPFETREITFTLNVNSPTETPAVNIGDILNYTATIVSPATDDMPNDNTFVLNQTVVNSYDPNDKTCLEGTTIPPTKVGDYVHYMIRFENNGTANAQNIVVKDMIDMNKFDVSTLVLIKGSHNFFTRINGNKVEFIFENINLPFDDANNDGYVSFKIKTKPTLTNGDTFSNSASIYFDYNFPIVTNTATTTIQALSSQDFEFSNYFNLYPNPVSTTLNIDAKDAIQISSIIIYNTLGQLVLVVPNAQETKIVDVSSLSSGNYFIKINSDKGTSNTKFIKQ